MSAYHENGISVNCSFVLSYEIEAKPKAINFIAVS